MSMRPMEILDFLYKKGRAENKASAYLGVRPICYDVSNKYFNNLVLITLNKKLNIKQIQILCLLKL